jgi:hypothetical protein
MYYTLNELENSISSVIDSLKQMLYNRHEDIFEKIDFGNDNIYMEPLLYSYVFQNDDKWLDSIIYGYRREKPDSISVFSNREGIVYLPMIGYFYTDLKYEGLTLKQANGEYLLFFNERPVSYKFAPVYYLEHGIELLLCLHPLFESLFIEQDVAVEDIAVEHTWKEFVPRINDGLKIVAAANPVFFQKLQKNLKKILVFDGAAPNPFAAMKAHNMIFINTRDQGGKLFFADRISHEGGHVIFFSLTYESKYTLFHCHPNTPFLEITKNNDDHGTIYLRFHGLFTYLSILGWLLEYSKKSLNDREEVHELKGRTLFHLQRFHILLQKFLVLSVFEPEGERWLKVFEDFFNRNGDTYMKLAEQYSIEGQPYDFSYEMFNSFNPVKKYAY